jgi:hypothetical protein
LSPHDSPADSKPGTLQTSAGLATKTSSQLAESYALAHNATLLGAAPVPRALSAEEHTGSLRSMQRATSP